ncbi:MAG: hypothetical protein ABIY63_15975 [Fibrobacteria bacterium]
MVMRKFIGLALVSLAVLAPRAASAQGATFKGDNFAITFQPTAATSSWKMVDGSTNIITKTGGLNGMATMGATVGSTLPNLDSLTLVFADSLGGELKKDSSKTLTLGAYEVHWQKYTYDTLPKLSKLVSAAAGFTITLKNGSFRVYYLTSGGYQFTLACMSILNGVAAPYADVEEAIKTLKLSASAGIRNRVGMVSRDLWIRNGELGGGWLLAHKPTAIEAFDARGFRIGSGVLNAKGNWSLPVSRQEMFLRVHADDGSSLQFVVHP